MSNVGINVDPESRSKEANYKCEVQQRHYGLKIKVKRFKRLRGLIETKYLGILYINILKLLYKKTLELEIEMGSYIVI